jgi:predicted kinase
VPLLAHTTLPALPPNAAAFDWDACVRSLPVLGSLEGCAQDPIHHPEGDVAVHTRLVVRALLDEPRFQALPVRRRRELYLAALLHDSGKPIASRVENGRIVSPGHARLGSILARRALWEAGEQVAARERICALVRGHMHPFFHLAQDPVEARRRALAISVQVACADLALHSVCDGRGRTSAGAGEWETNAELFAAACEELGCLDQPFPFASDHARFLFFARSERDPAYAAWDDTRCTLTLMCGLPGAGKDAWLAANEPELPVVSLDEIRAERKVAPTDPQGPVVQLAKERLREHLRAGRDCAWNATSLTRLSRGQVTSLAWAYKARVRIVQVEIPAGEHDARNRGRGHERAVPADAIERMLRRWEAPDLTECHELLVVESRW